MAVINKIRRYSGLAIFFIGISIVAFILADLLGPGGGLLGGGKRYVGEINGVKISFEEYDQVLNQQIANYRLNTNQSPDENQMTSLREQAWNNLIQKYAFEEEYNELSIKVSEEERVAMVQGDSLFIHPWVRQQFTDQETGEFRKAQLINYLQNFDQLPPQQKYAWVSFEDQMVKNRIQTKYTDLMRFSAYVTQAEAQQQYQNQTAKAEIKYLYVPFSSILDSTLIPQITDAQLEKYLDEHPEKYKAQETRTLEYVALEINPSAQDSAAFQEEIKQLATEFVKTEDDSSFAVTYSDNVTPFRFQTVKELPIKIFDENDDIEVGKVYGPYTEGVTYNIYKVSEVKEDTAEFVRARHILFSVQPDADDEKKAEIREQANEVLQKIKDGADFAAMARQYGSDGTKDKGGDLGFFGKGDMVGPFEEASFVRDEKGLVPNLVETRFGYHILGVTYPKTNKTYKVATIQKSLDPSQETINQVFRRAQELRSKANTYDELKATAEADSSIILQNSGQLNPTASNIGPIRGAREIVRWSFTDAKVGEVSDVLETQEGTHYIIAALTKKTEKDASDVEIFRDQLQMEVLKEMKAKQIIEKLDAQAKTLEDMAKKYGNDAQVNTANDLTMSTNTIQNTGLNPKAVGKAFGLKDGEKTEPFRDENGVFVLQLIKKTPAPKIADYTQYKNQLLNTKQQRAQFMTNQAVREAAEIEDKRYKYY